MLLPVRFGVLQHESSDIEAAQISHFNRLDRFPIFFGETETDIIVKAISSSPVELYSAELSIFTVSVQIR